MTSEFLEVYKENTFDLLEEMLPMINAGTADAKIVEYACRNYRIRGIISVLLEADTSQFQDCLRKSCQTFIKGIKKLPVKARPPLSKFEAVFDALALADGALMREILSLSDLQYNEGCEYEEDFLFVACLARLFFVDTKEDELNALFDRYEEIAEGEDEAKFCICNAIRLKDEKLFESAFDDYLNSYHEFYKMLEQSGNKPEEETLPLRSVSIRGLALLRIAKQLKFPTQKEYLGIPSSILQVNRGSNLNGTDLSARD